MFERYTDPCKRAVFFARHLALVREAAAINSDHLLQGLLLEFRSRAGDMFHLRDLLLEDVARVDGLTKHSHIKNPDIPLTDDAKRVLAYTAQEADRLRNYWIDTEHLVLGMMREGNNIAATKLGQVGLDLESCRKRAIDTAGSRKLRPNLLMWWARRFPPSAILPAILPFVFVLGIIVAFYLLGFGRR